ncbi:VOC family protein [Brevundimonas sp. FT23042]|uniref:VOC family protein n=1 Tax=Brevundimonas sp. FT23042 TaxID=3393749 RepID=UPI003B58726A
MTEVFLHHVHLVTHDIERFCDFYIRYFDAEVVFDAPIAGDRNLFLKIGTGRIHLFESRTAPPTGRNAFHHLGMMVTDLARFVEKLKADGVQVTAVTIVPGGGFAMATGPDDVRIELFEANTPEARRVFIDPES